MKLNFQSTKPVTRIMRARLHHRKQTGKKLWSLDLNQLILEEQNKKKKQFFKKKQKTIIRVISSYPDKPESWNQDKLIENKLKKSWNSILNQLNL